MVVDQSGPAQAPGQGGRKDQPGIGHQAVVIKDDKDDADTVGIIAWQHLDSSALLCGRQISKGRYVGRDREPGSAL